MLPGIRTLRTGLWSLLLAAGGAQAETLLYFNDFQTGFGPEWSSSSPYTWGLEATPSPDDGSRRFLGYFGGNDTVVLTLSSLPAGVATVRLEFDAYFMWSWDGNDTRPVDGVNRGPDVFGFRAGAGATPGDAQSWTFSHGNPDLSRQTYCDGQASPCLPTTGAAERYTLGYHFDILPTEEDLGSTQAAPMDSVYHFVWEGAAPDTGMTFTFFSQGLQVRDDLAFPYLDEAWGLDNVRITAVPEPGIWALFLGGLALVAHRRRPGHRA